MSLEAQIVKVRAFVGLLRISRPKRTKVNKLTRERENERNARDDFPKLQFAAKSGLNWCPGELPGALEGRWVPRRATGCPGGRASGEMLSEWKPNKRAMLPKSECQRRFLLQVLYRCNLSQKRPQWVPQASGLPPGASPPGPPVHHRVSF